MASRRENEGAGNVVFRIDGRRAEAGCVVVRFLARHVHVIAHSQIQRQTLGNLEIVLDKEGVIPGRPALSVKFDGLAAIGRLAQLQTGKANTASLSRCCRSLATAEVDIGAVTVDWRILLEAQVTAKLDTVTAMNPDDSIVQPEAIIDVIVVLGGVTQPGYGVSRTN